MVDFYPGLHIVIGPRSILSLLGVISIISTHWWAEGIFDDVGSTAYYTALSDAGMIPSSTSPQSAQISVIEETLLSTVDVPESDLLLAYPRPYTLLIGWFLFGISFLLSNEQGYGFEISASGIVAMVCCFFLGAVSFCLLRQAMVSRDVDKLRKITLSMIVASVFLAVSASFANTDMPYFVCPLGVIFILLSSAVLWQCRKMGEHWIVHGRPKPNPVVCNPAGLYLVFGWYLLWLGCEAVYTEEESTGPLPQFPIFISDRSTLANCTIILIAFFTCMADYAHDEGALPDGTTSDVEGMKPQNQDAAAASAAAAFGIYGKFFGRVNEVWIPFTLLGFLFGLCSFLQYFYTGKPIVDICFITVTTITGRIVGLLYSKGIHEGLYEYWRKCSLMLIGILGILILIVALFSWQSLLLGILGTLCLVYGHYALLRDRKRGLTWIRSRVIEESPKVYSFGYLFYMVGLICWALGMSIPDNIETEV